MISYVECWGAGDCLSSIFDFSSQGALAVEAQCDFRLGM